ncbi:MAG: L,D-transpeptidase [Actinomycetota bacterium]|nr:L,D-transpeptidase [Actinomycetota bacterium]
MMKAFTLRGSVLVAAVAAVLALGLPLASAAQINDGTARPTTHTTGVRSGPGADLPPEIAAVPARPSEPSSASSVLVRITHDVAMRAHPGHGRVVGILPAGSKYYRTPTVAWVQHLSPDRRFGELAVPYSASGTTGWIRLRGLKRRSTFLEVDVDLSRHRVVVERRGRVLFGTRAAIGSPSSPTPIGSYFVTDRASFPFGGALGTYAFGISGIQPNLPAGWSGGNQLAIHGTNDPASIGRSVSAGCLRVPAAALRRLVPLLRLGTPVVIHP